MARCSPFGGAAANERHSAYGFRFARIAYRWHPLFGRVLQVSPHRRGEDLLGIYTGERPDLSRELPGWMLDESYCADMALGPPTISIEGLNELVEVLASLRETQGLAARSRSSVTRENDDAEKSVSGSSAAPSCAGTAESPGAAGVEPERAARGSGRASVGGGRRRRTAQDGRGG
jgi:hypothetical protein